MNSPLIFRASFRTGITLKGIDGLLEAVGGVLLWFIKPEQLSSTLQEIFEHELLRDPHWHEHRIADVAAEAGFSDLSHFSRAFRRRFGATPSQTREAQRRGG